VLGRFSSLVAFALPGVVAAASGACIGCELVLAVLGRFGSLVVSALPSLAGLGDTVARFGSLPSMVALSVCIIKSIVYCRVWDCGDSLLFKVASPDKHVEEQG
jgi:hypothetical protein